MINHGSLVISLDFEMMWGNIEKYTPQGYGKTNVENVRLVIDKLLLEFQKYGVHATFATVGMLMHNNKQEVLDNIPQLKPSYNNNVLSPYENNYIQSISSDDEHLYFAPDIIEKLKRYDGIEIGSHTYCHYFCWESGQTTEQFESDLQKAIEIANSNGIELKCMVFPRNNVAKEYLGICRKYGISSYRGNAINYFMRPKNRLHRLRMKIMRMVDSYINVGGMSSTPYNEIDLSERPVNLRASRLIRPYSRKLSCFEWIRLRRIKKEIIYAARHNEMYHLWWHPHNFGANIDKNIRFIDSVLKCYQECHIKYGMESYTIDEMKTELLINYE